MPTLRPKRIVTFESQLQLKRIQQAAGCMNRKFSEFMREVCDVAAKKILETRKPGEQFDPVPVVGAEQLMESQAD